ncbi:MAG: protein TolQ [Deltaproteobacteria bacterium]|nr:protein TolQ [Deltaproteobacteria bacterium]
MVLGTGMVVQFVLLLLFFFSVVSWAIILMKYLNFSRVRRENRSFLKSYMKSAKLSDVLADARRFKYSTVAQVFQAGYTELVNMSKNPGGASAPSPEMKGVMNMERALNSASDSEITGLESFLSFLATTGSVCPFIGLFGTVWGIMDTFKGVGMRGSATLAVVAPGISEALIATAAGLAAAIPAVIFYNVYLNSIKAMSLEMENFSSDFLNSIERNAMKR